jgi:MFS family permease
VQVWHIILMAFLLGLSNSVDAPARQAFIKDMVGNEDMPSGITVSSLMMNGARVVGPTIAGVLLAAFGAGWCFFMNGITFLAVLISLLVMQINGFTPGVGRGSPLRQMREGMDFSRRHGRILPLLLLAAVVSSFGVNTMTLLPAFADLVLHSPTDGLSLLSAAQGVGAVFAGLLLTTLGYRFGRGRVTAIMLLLMSWSMVMLARTALLEMSAVLMAVFGFCLTLFFVNANTMIQNEVPDGYRGRVMSLFTLTFMGLTPFGALALGGMANQIGTPDALLIYGLINGALGLYVLLRWREVWRIA